MLVLESSIINDTAFRRKFKFYKQRMTEPDLSDVFDLNSSNLKIGVTCQPVDASLLSEKDKNFVENNSSFRYNFDYLFLTLISLYKFLNFCK